MLSYNIYRGFFHIELTPRCVMKTLFYDEDYPKHLELFLAGVFMAIANFLECLL